MRFLVFLILALALVIPITSAHASMARESAAVRFAARLAQKGNDPSIIQVFIPGRLRAVSGS
jgi:hypothetical protein